MSAEVLQPRFNVYAGTMIGIRRVQDACRKPWKYALMIGRHLLTMQQVSSHRAGPERISSSLV